MKLSTKILLTCSCAVFITTGCETEYEKQMKDNKERSTDVEQKINYLEYNSDLSQKNFIITDFIKMFDEKTQEISFQLSYKTFFKGFEDNNYSAMIEMKGINGKDTVIATEQIPLPKFEKDKEEYVLVIPKHKLSNEIFKDHITKDEALMKTQFLLVIFDKNNKESLIIQNIDEAFFNNTNN